jgi:fatty acid desaturase
MSEENRSPIMSLLISLIKEVITQRIAMIKKKMMRYCTAMVLMFVAMIAIIFGLGAFVGWLFPILPAGTSHMIVGLVFIIAAAICAKTA